MLLRSGRSIFQNPALFTGGPIAGQYGNSFKGGGKNRFVGGLNNRFSAYPSGYLSPSGFILPQKSGAIASRKESDGVIVGSSNLIPAYNLEASASAAITVTNAQLDQIVSAVANGTATISVVNAILAGAATLQANGTLTLTSNADIGAIFSVTADSNGQITTDTNLTALAFMNAEAGGPTPLSPEGLAQAVWNENLTDYTGSTAGQALKDAGSAGNPWSANLADNQTEGTFGWFVQKLLTLGKFLGLK